MKSLGSTSVDRAFISTVDSLAGVLIEANKLCCLALDVKTLDIFEYEKGRYGVYVDYVMVGSFSITKLY